MRRPIVGHSARDDARAVAMLEPPVVRAYLERIGHPPVPEPTADVLASLQDAHVRSVPFENLDIHLGRRLSLDLTALVGKVIDRRRGGFCYELNALFSTLLTALGYDTRLVEARMRLDDDTGHITLADRQLITTRHGQRHEQDVNDPLAVLATRFGVTIPRWPGS